MADRSPRRRRRRPSPAPPLAAVLAAVLYAALLLLLLLPPSPLCPACDAFAPAARRAGTRPRGEFGGGGGRTRLAGFLDDLFNVRKGDDRGDDDDAPRWKDAEIVDEGEVEGAYVGSRRIMTIPAKTMKMGGLRLYCNLYLMGLQNTPDAGCWKASKSDDSEVNLRHRDLSGSIIIRFEEGAGITVDRLGSSPSMTYLAHESVILNGFLDELHAIVYEGDIEERNRLLTLEEEDAIDRARGAVSFA